MSTLLPEKIYHQLRRQLLAGEMHPGSRLDYRKISEEMGVSTTPVREAMSKLASEGFVDLIPRAGAIVREFGRQEAEHLYGVREAIETYAATKAAEKISTASLSQLDNLLVRMSGLIKQTAAKGNGIMSGETLINFLEADLAFHMTIIEAAGNPRLVKLAGDSHIHSRIFGVERFGHAQELVEEADHIHRLIFDALRHRAAAQASKLVAQHIARSLELTLAHFDHGHANSWLRKHTDTDIFAQPVIAA